MPTAAPQRSSLDLTPLRVPLGFALAILLGSLLLRLPAAARTTPIPYIDTLFISTSAVCVTGLTPDAIGERLTRSGQAILIVLVQLGGLGITTASTFLILLAGRATLSHHMEFRETMAAERVSTTRLLGLVVLMTFVAEGLGAIFLARKFQGPDSAWYGVFHSISAFCNAGFALFPDSFHGQRTDLAFNAVIAALIMLGGIGFIVLYQLVAWLAARLRGRAARLPLHARVVLFTNAALWFAGAAVFLAVERGNSLRGLSFRDQSIAAVFQSITARTAGFDTIDVSHWREFTLYGFMFLMLIGASPGSCGGGVKVTTIAVILATVRARLRGREQVALFERSLAAEVVQRSFLILSLSLLFLSVMVGALLLLEGDGQRGSLTSLAFETVSAYGTVGLSTGITPNLSAGGKVVIIICMFVGRLGPLAIALAAVRRRDEVRFDYPEEPIAIG